jgi:glycosyltransferase involved in cell wall biosynthesis
VVSRGERQGARDGGALTGTSPEPGALPSAPASPAGVIIGIDARLEPGRHGGVEQYVIGIAHGLSSLTDGDEEYRFLVYPGASQWLAPYVSGRARIVEAPVGPSAESRSAAARRRIAAAVPWIRAGWRVLASRLPAARPDRDPLDSDETMATLGADLVHFPFQRGFRTDLPTIYQPWDLQHRHLPELFSPSVIRWREATYRALCEQARIVVTASQWTKQDVGSSYAISPDRIAVVNVPAPIAAYAAPSESEVGAIASALGLPARFLLYPAQAWPHKNHARLFAALALARQRGIDAYVVLTGSTGDGRRRLQDEARRHGVADLVTMPGFVEPPQMHAAYQLAAGLIFPSLFEGWGLPIVEAFTSGVPVACSNVTSLPELVGDAAIVFEPTDVEEIAAAIARLWSDGELTEELVARGRKRLERLTWPGTARRLRALYRLALGAGLTADDRQILQDEPPV